MFILFLAVEPQDIKKNKNTEPPLPTSNQESRRIRTLLESSVNPLIAPERRKSAARKKRRMGFFLGVGGMRRRSSGGRGRGGGEGGVRGKKKKKSAPQMESDMNYGG